LAVAISVTPLSNASAGSALIGSISYTPQDTAPAKCRPGPPQYTLLWEDDFNGTTLGPQWTAYDNCTHGAEAQLYVSDAVTVADGMLKLTAFEFPANKTDRQGNAHQYGSGWVDSASNRSSRALNDCWSNSTESIPYNFLYGKWEIRAKMPHGHFWVAAWLMPDAKVCWPQGGEVDILESDIWGQQPPYEPHAAYHWSTPGSQCYKDMSQKGDGAALKSPPGFDFSKDFHVYSVELTERIITFSVDGIP
jgi:beta-glucanase (GH16 family)